MGHLADGARRFHLSLFAASGHKRAKYLTYYLLTNHRVFFYIRFYIRVSKPRSGGAQAGARALSRSVCLMIGGTRDPESEPRAWLEKLAEADRKRSSLQDIAAPRA